MNHYDVAIIGGGLIGCAASYYLSKQGLSCCVIERGQINRQASGRNAGSLHFQLEHRLIRGGKQAVAAIAPLLVLSRLAISDWQTLEKELNTKLEVHMGGGLMLAENEQQIQLIQAKQQYENQYGLNTELWSKSQVLQQAPYLSAEHIAGAGWLTQEGSANPRLVTPAFAKQSANQGTVFFSENQVISTDFSANKWHVECAQPLKDAEFDSKQHSLTASSLLNASGANIGDTAKLNGFDLPMNKLALLMNVTTKIKPIIPHFIQHVSENLSLKQLDSGNILISGGWPAKFNDISGKTEIILDNVYDNINLAIRLAPQLAQTSLLRTWTGVAGTTPDELPYLGVLCEKSRLFVAGGGSAFTLGPTIARLVSDLIANKSLNIDLTPFKPTRFTQSTGSS